MFQVRHPRLASIGCAFLRAQHLLKPSVHFLFFDELPALSRFKAFFNGGKDARFLVEITVTTLVTSCSVSVPEFVAICASRASCSGVKCTSMFQR
jgi:hypothetical protein